MPLPTSFDDSWSTRLTSGDLVIWPVNGRRAFGSDDDGADYNRERGEKFVCSLTVSMLVDDKNCRLVDGRPGGQTNKATQASTADSDRTVQRNES